MDNTAPNPRTTPPPPPLPRFAWTRPGVDPEAPRLPFDQYLRLIALQAEIDYPCGPDTDPGASLGALISSYLLAIAEQSVQLGAWDPASYIERSQAEADRAAAYLQALMHEADHGSWVIIQPSPEDLSDDANGGWGGHESNPDFGEPADGAQRGYFSRDVDDETWVN